MTPNSTRYPYCNVKICISIILISNTDPIEFTHT